MKIKKENRSDYLTLFDEIESLYVKDRFVQIINIKETHSNINLLDSSNEKFKSFSEILAVSYIEVGNLKKGMDVINVFLNYLKNKGIITKDDFEDLTIFYSLKIEIYESRKSSIKQLRTILDYCDNGGNDSYILGKKAGLQEIIYNRFILINKIVISLVIGLIILSIIRLVTINKPLLTMLTTFGVIWYILNYIFHKKIKKIFIKLID